jgi:hypothetical protein
MIPDKFGKGVIAVTLSVVIDKFSAPTGQDFRAGYRFYGEEKNWISLENRILWCSIEGWKHGTWRREDMGLSPVL